MKKMNLPFVAITLALIIGLVLPTAAFGQAEAVFKGKCAGCHGADGTGSAIGKKMGAHDFTSADVQKMSDADLTEAITNGKNKMPGYGKSLKADEIKGLVTYIRTLKK